MRETWAPCDDLAIGHDLEDAENVAYQADLSACFFDGHQPLDTRDWNWDFVGTEKKRGWRPSIHMPRWASRITLEVTDVRVERLLHISEEDARAEGIAAPVHVGREARFAAPGVLHTNVYGDHDTEAPAYVSAKLAYASLWDSINGPAAWDANPWVWAVSFKRVSP